MKKIEEELKELAKNFEYQAKLLEDSQSKTYANVLCVPTTSGLSPNSTPVRKSLPTPSALKDKLIHSEKPIADTRNSFLDVQTLKHVEEFLYSELRKGTFEEKNGHHVLNLGRQYLNKGKKTNNDNPEHVSIPDPLKNVLDKIYSEFDGEYDLNCVLVKHLSEGSDSHLTENTFDYCTINPDSHIFSLSIGEPRKLAFVDLSTKEVVQDYMCHSNSLYLMSRHSQNFFSHRIDKVENSEKAHFTISFMCVDQRFKRSTIILGDSNTKRYKFGEGVGTFGRGLPGKRIETMLIEHINPADCMSYNNVIIQCGINNITSSRTPINGPRDVRTIFDIFKNNIDQIMSVTNKVNVYIVPILPTRSVTYNRAVHVFNSLIKSDIIDFYYCCMCINISELEFSDGSLRPEFLYADWDNIHTNIKAIRKVAHGIRSSIYLKYNSGRKINNVTVNRSGNIRSDATRRNFGMVKGRPTP